MSPPPDWGTAAEPDRECPDRHRPGRWPCAGLRPELDPVALEGSLHDTLATVSTIASPVLNSSGLISAPIPGRSGGRTWPLSGAGTSLTKYGYWRVYFQ